MQTIPRTVDWFQLRWCPSMQIEISTIELRTRNYLSPDNHHLNYTFLATLSGKRLSRGNCYNLSVVLTPWADFFVQEKSTICWYFVQFSRFLCCRFVLLILRISCLLPLLTCQNFWNPDGSREIFISGILIEWFRFTKHWKGRCGKGETRNHHQIN